MFWKITKWVLIVLVVGYVVLVIGRAIYFYKQDKTDEQVKKIHNTKITLADVMGENLPLPGAVMGAPDYDATVQGLDENNNGIRDDVEV